MQFFFCKDEARVETVIKIVPNFAYYNHLEGQNLSSLTEKNQYVNYDNHKVTVSATL